MVISAQWELVLGNSFGYTVLAAFGTSLSLFHFDMKIFNEGVSIVTGNT